MRIGFIAMSGLRICKPELLELGFTFPNVAERARQIEALPTLGLLTLAGMTPAHIDVEYLEVRDVHDGPLPTRFDAVAISTLAAVSKEAYALAHRFRSAGTPVIIGGLHPTLRPQEAMIHADAIAIGEGELIWPQIVADLERGALKRIYDARGMGPFDLSNAPMPRFDLLGPTQYPRFSVQTQRGCPWSCEFCASSIRLNPKFRVKPIEKVIAEIRQLKALYGNPFIEFADDNTFVNRDHGRKLMKALEREHICWFTESDLNVADDPELLAMMRDAGCAQVLIGFESSAF
ncbi:MAG TPA: radical SAM protein [Rhodothermales bacterium]|nr:radical SAM protein [Rhodothermales bacterium]